MSDIKEFFPLYFPIDIIRLIDSYIVYNPPRINYITKEKLPLFIHQESNWEMITNFYYEGNKSPITILNARKVNINMNGHDFIMPNQNECFANIFESSVDFKGGRIIRCGTVNSMTFKINNYHKNKHSILFNDISILDYEIYMDIKNALLVNITYNYKL